MVFFFFSSHLDYYLWQLGGFKKKFARECLSYFYLHLCALKFYWRSLTSCLPWWACWILLAKWSHWLLAFSIGFSFQLVSLSLWTYSFKDLLFISVGPILCWIFENWYLLMAQPYLWCKCYDLLLLYALLHLLRILDDFGGARIPYLCTPQ